MGLDGGAETVGGLRGGLQDIPSAVLSLFENRKLALREPPAALPELPHDVGGGGDQEAWKEVVLTGCTRVFACRPCRWSHPEVCAHVLCGPRV